MRMDDVQPHRMKQRIRNCLVDHHHLIIAYDITMAILSILVVIALILDIQGEFNTENTVLFYWFDKTVWGIFVIDYGVRFWFAERKFYFFRHNLIELIAILPFDVMFQGFRSVRALKIVYLLRSFVYLNRSYGRLSVILNTTGFMNVLWFTFCTVFIGAIAVCCVDDVSFGDALWWSFVTTTTVGYGDIAPTSVGGRLIAVFLMIVGIGFLSILTGTIATFFMNQMSQNKSLDYTHKEVRLVIEQLNDFDHLSTQDLTLMWSTLLRLKKEQKN